jgi:hypothetical protein
MHFLHTAARLPVATVIGLLMLPLGADGHHSVGAVYDVAKIIELEGPVTRVVWRNPHVRFTVRVRNDRGQDVLWDVETHSVSILRRMQVSPDVLKVGDRVRVAGNPGRGGGTDFFAHNLLLPGGQEVLLQPGTAARWSKNTVGRSDTWLAKAGRPDAKLGIFRVWSSSLADPGLFGSGPLRGTAQNRFPLTPAAAAALARFDYAKDDPTRNCAPKGMPTIMSQPYPIEFTQQGMNIMLRIEEYDTVRMIRMTAGDTGKPAAPSRLGYSVGRWEGRTLVVTTTSTSWRHFNGNGIPLGPAATMVERFTPSLDGSQLNYELTVTDAATFTMPVTVTKRWIWLPDVKISPYECTNN